MTNQYQPEPRLTAASEPPMVPYQGTPLPKKKGPPIPQNMPTADFYNGNGQTNQFQPNQLHIPQQAEPYLPQQPVQPAQGLQYNYGGDGVYQPHAPVQSVQSTPGQQYQDVPADMVAQQQMPVDQSGLAPELKETLITDYINLLICACLVNVQGQTGLLDQQQAYDQNTHQVRFWVNKKNVAGQNVEFDQTAAMEGNAAFNQFTQEDPFCVELIITQAPMFQLQYRAFSSRNRTETVQLVNLPNSSPTVPELFPEDEKPEPAPQPVQQSNPQPTMTQQPIEQESQLTQFDYDAETTPPLITMANQICRQVPLSVMNNEELLIIAQAYILTSATASFVSTNEAVEYLKHKYGDGWSRSTIQRNIKKGKPFAWVHGVHYLGSPSSVSFLNINAISLSLTGE